MDNDTMVAVTLKPCPNPWCVSTSRPLPAFASRSETWSVICGCGVRSFGRDTEAEAIATWNTRIQSEGRTGAGEALAARIYVSFTDGMQAAAEICGSLAETTYDDSDGFEAATGCEAAIMRVVREQRVEQAKGGGGR